MSSRGCFAILIAFTATLSPVALAELDEVTKYTLIAEIQRVQQVQERGDPAMQAVVRNAHTKVEALSNVVRELYEIGAQKSAGFSKRARAYEELEESWSKVDLNPYTDSKWASSLAESVSRQCCMMATRKVYAQRMVRKIKSKSARNKPAQTQAKRGRGKDGAVSGGRGGGGGRGKGSVSKGGGRSKGGGKEGGGRGQGGGGKGGGRGKGGGKRAAPSGV